MASYQPAFVNTTSPDHRLSQDSDVPRERLTLDITDLKERIEEIRSEDPAWRELSLSGKIRALLIQQLETLEQQKKSSTTESKDK